jgi:hypothetical protein
VRSTCQHAFRMASPAALFGSHQQRTRPNAEGCQAHIVGREPDICIRCWRMFDRHVAVGRLTRREVIEACPDLPQLEYRRLFYALPGHEWRVDAMLTLLNEPEPGQTAAKGALANCLATRGGRSTIG